MKLYRTDIDLTEPKEVGPHPSGNPHLDSDGEVITPSTHFEDLGAAWRALVELHSAACSRLSSSACEAMREAREVELAARQAEADRHTVVVGALKHRIDSTLDAMGPITRSLVKP